MTLLPVFISPNADLWPAIHDAAPSAVHVRDASALDEILQKHGADTLYVIADIDACEAASIDILSILHHIPETPHSLLIAEDYSRAQQQTMQNLPHMALTKPFLPARLTHAVQTGLISGKSADHKDGVLQAVELALKTASSGQGRAFGAIIVDAEGHVIGKGHSAISQSVDPLNFAEASAIQQATSLLNTMDLSHCTLYSSFEPTQLGKALIAHVKIGQAYYALSFSDITAADEGTQKSAPTTRETTYQQLCLNEAKAAFSIA